jgi:hypothetical protein
MHLFAGSGFLAFIFGLVGFTPAGWIMAAVFIPLALAIVIVFMAAKLGGKFNIEDKLPEILKMVLDKAWPSIKAQHDALRDDFIEKAQIKMDAEHEVDLEDADKEIDSIRNGETGERISYLEGQEQKLKRIIPLFTAGNEK